MRWTEEVQLLQEEMRRTQEYHDWRAGWWEKQAVLTVQQRADLLEGMCAYAHRQASIRRQMRNYCQRAWSHVRAWVCLGQEVSDAIDPPAGEPSDSEAGDMPSLYTASASSVASLQAALEEELRDVADVDLALEDFD